MPDHLRILLVDNLMIRRYGNLRMGPGRKLMTGAIRNNWRICEFSDRDMARLLAPLGMRSWGGVVGIRGSLPFIDGGSLTRPEFAPFDENGNWVIEGYGVDPDIVIDNDPAREFEGIDDQLNKAIEVILEQMKDYPDIPAIPAWPDKTK